MARNRKRSRDRRPRRPATPPALATAADDPVEAAPEPLAHAAPDTELAEAQMALGRPELTEAPDEEDLDELAEDEAPATSTRSGRGRRGAEVDVASSAAPAERQPMPARLANFLRGSYRELQRVQWPDRRQVFQATGVVIGFVIVAGVFLGVADVVAQKVVNFILYGHG